MNRLGMVINVSHASDDAISQAIDVSSDPVIATHHGLREYNDIPRNMPDWLLKKLAAKGGLIGFQIGNEFHNRKVFDWRTQHAGKPFWDTAKVNSSDMSIEDIDKIVAPQFPMLGSAAPDELKFNVDDWLKVTDRAIQLVGEDHVILGDGLRRRTHFASAHERHPRHSADHRGHAAPWLLGRTYSKGHGRKSAACVPPDHR